MCDDPQVCANKCEECINGFACTLCCYEKYVKDQTPVCSFHDGVLIDYETGLHIPLETEPE